MRQKFLVLFFSLISIITIRADSQKKNYDPLLTVVLMVKNEASVIQDTLQPFVDAVINDAEKKISFLIFDTGSTDSTMLVAKQYFKENCVDNAVIRQEPFIDFSASRNRALQLAEEAFPNACFMLMPDAEWYMHNVSVLLQFCQRHQNDRHNSYLVRIMNPSIDFYTPRLIRCHTGVHFVGAVHEVLNVGSYEKVPQDCFFEWAAQAHGIEKSRKRWSHDLTLLLKDFERNPFDPRTVFYMGQTYECLNDLKNAALWYRLHLTIPASDEEHFIARYRLAQIDEKLGNWDQALSNYLMAFSMRPCRAEPLIRLSQHYLQTGEMDLCYLFSRRAVEIPYPDKEILFIDKELYDYTRYDHLGISAWYVGEYEIGKEAVLQALTVAPDAPHLQRNLDFYRRAEELCND